MKNTLKNAITLVLAVLIVLSTLTVGSFASNENEKEKLSVWLSDTANTDFDFSDTSYLDTNICWTVFALEKAGKTAYSEYEEYISSVVSNSFDSLYPSSLALIYITAIERGQNVSDIGSHDILAALKSADYSTQTFLSSLSYPLIALNYKKTAGCDDVKNTIINTIIAAQQSDGGFAYSTVDSGYGIYSDIDTTTMTIQSLAPYYNSNAAVKDTVDRALAYVETQKFDDGSYGYKAYNSPSADSTAQAIIALCILKSNPGNSLNALKSYIDDSGAAKDYSGAPNTMSSYQTLLALIENDNYLSGKGSIFDFAEETATTVTVKDNDTTKTNETTSVILTTGNNNVDIPKTGGTISSIFAFSAIFAVAGISVVLRKKNEEV